MIAGCYVTRGVIRRNAQIRVVREGTVIYETTIASLKRFKDDVREVQEGFECGILLEGFNDVKEGDVLEAYETREIERTDLSVAGNGGRRAGGRPENRVRRKASSSLPGGMGSGYVGILSVELHFPDNHSLKGKRKELLSVKAQLQRRFGALGGRGRPPRRLAALAADPRVRRARHDELLGLLDGAERYLASQAFELVRVEREVVTLDD